MSSNDSPFSGGRVYSIDVLRGLTIFTMIFVNDLGGVRNIPEWMKHAGTYDDTMTFVDVVFPAFLFIVGMAIPLAMRAREVKGKSRWPHVLMRSFGLLVLGVFMVNTEGGYNEAAMGMNIHLWAVSFYVAAILAWNQFPEAEGRREKLYIGLRALGIAGLIALFLVYRRGEDGTQWMQPLWWGILGLIGWAYLWSSGIYLGISRHWWLLLLLAFACLGVYSGMNSEAFSLPENLQPWLPGSGHFTHTALVLAGMVLTLFFFPGSPFKDDRSRIMGMLGYAALVFAAGYLWRPLNGISKNLATPTWALYSMGICILVYLVLYVLVDMKGIKRWADFFAPAGSNPLLIYLIPPLIYHVMWGLDITFYGEMLGEGWIGIVRSLAFASLMLLLVKGLNRAGVRMKL